MYWCLEQFRYPEKLKEFILMEKEPYVLSTQIDAEKPYSLDDVNVLFKEHLWNYDGVVLGQDDSTQ